VNQAILAGWYRRRDKRNHRENQRKITYSGVISKSRKSTLQNLSTPMIGPFTSLDHATSLIKPGNPDNI